MEASRGSGVVGSIFIRGNDIFNPAFSFTTQHLINAFRMWRKVGNGIT